MNLRLLYWYAAFAHRTFDIIHCHLGPVGISGAHLKELGIPGRLVTTFHGYDAGLYPHEHGLGVYRTLFRVGDLFTANTDYTAHRMVYLGCPSNRLVVLPVGVDLSSLTFRERTLMPGEPVKLLTVARLVEKRLKVWIHQAAQRNPKFQRRLQNPILSVVHGRHPLLSTSNEYAGCHCWLVQQCPS